MAAAAEGIDGVYSVRLVIADFYMEKPQFGLDPCYSELRGKEIKRVSTILFHHGWQTGITIHVLFPTGSSD